MNDEMAQTRSAFQKAASTLGISFAHPPIEGLDGLGAHLIGHLPHFGGPKGCVPMLLNTPEFVVASVKSAGYYFSLLASSYTQFDPVLFRDTLDDWGYFGPPEWRPVWFTGQQWGAKA